MFLMTNEEKMTKYLQRNVKLFPPFLALTWDVLFVWTISTMFFTTQKGLDFSQVVMLDSVLMIIGCVICVPVTNLFKNVNAVTASQIGVLGYAIYLIMCIFGNHFAVFLLAQFFLSFGYIACGIKGNSVLTKSLNILKRDKDYDRVYGKGISLFYVLEAIGAIGITYIYNWQPYVAYWISFAVVIFVFFYSFLLKSPEKFQQQNIVIDARQPATATTDKHKKESTFLKVLKSPFFICLLMFMFLMRGTTSITNSNFKMYLQQIIELGALPASMFGYIYAGGKLLTAISSKYQFKFNLKFGVRSIIIFVVSLIVSFFAAGAVAMLMPVNWISITLIIVISYVQMCIISPCRIFVNNYMQVCISPQDIEKAYSVRTMVEYLGYGLISALYSTLLTVFSDGYGIVSIVYMSILTLPIIITMILFIKNLIKKHAEKYTIIKQEYTEE